MKAKTEKEPMAFKIELTESEKQHLHQVIQQGKEKGRVRTRSQILVKIAEGWTVAEICEAFDTSPATVYNTHTRYQKGGVEQVTQDRVQQKRRRALNGDEEAFLIAITCSPVPEAHDHWTLRLLKNKLIEVGVVERISLATIQEILKKTNSNHGGTNRGASPH